MPTSLLFRAASARPRHTLIAAAFALLSASAGASFSAHAAAPSAASCGSAPSGELSAQRIVAANAAGGEPGLYEGPVWIGGALYFSDFRFGPGFPSRIQKLGADGVLRTAIADSGSNGLAVDARGDIVAATHKYKGLSRFKLADGKRHLVVGQYRGQVFNSPNDLTIAGDGTMYFTDPDFQRAAAPGGQASTNVYRLAASGALSVVDAGIANPNGIALSPRGDVLYVAGGGEQGFVRAYPVVHGVPGAGRDLVRGVSVPDGMAVDCHGNLYVTEHTARRIRVFSPGGKQLATIKVDANVTNAAFGGADGKTLFITGAGAVWQLKLDVTGSAY